MLSHWQGDTDIKADPKIFSIELMKIQPSQLFINSEKLAKVMKEFNPPKIEAFRPVPIKKLGDDIIFTDGHTRALAAFLNGLSEIMAFWDEDEMDWEAYEICVEWCKEAGICTIANLKDRVINDEDYKILWQERCSIMHRELEEKRAKGVGV